MTHAMNALRKDHFETVTQFVLESSDTREWRAALPTEECVTGGVEYIRLCEMQNGCPARLFVVESQDEIVAYPFLLRDASMFAEGIKGPVFDTFTPEYSGPVERGNGSGEARRRFKELFAEYCRNEGIIAEFAHLNPWREMEGVLEDEALSVNREIVYIDLTQDEEAIWNGQLNKDARRLIKQARSAGLVVRRAKTSDDVLKFHRLHHHTMSRRNATCRYYLSPEYFLQAFETMPQNAFFVLAELDGQAIAGGMFIHDRREVHWLLSAADASALAVRPVNGYLWETIRSLVGCGFERMILGGSYKDGDGIFRFKASFSPLRAKFHTYNRVHDRQRYDALTSAWREKRAPDASVEFFPAYRAP
jgi:serine/alanine adding enzyme